MIGAFQVGPFQLDYQQGAFVPPAGTSPIPDFTGIQWYAASDNIFEAGFLQTMTPLFVKNNTVAPGIVVGQLPLPGTYVPAGANIQLTVAYDKLLGGTFDLIIHKVPN
jgi:hypothetical protein